MVLGPKREAELNLRDGIRRRAQQGERAMRGCRTSHSACFKGRENNANAKKTHATDPPFGGGWPRCGPWVRIPPSTAMSIIASNAHALFRLIVSVVETRIRLVEDPNRWEETILGRAPAEEFRLPSQSTVPLLKT